MRAICALHQALRRTRTRTSISPLFALRRPAPKRFQLTSSAWRPRFGLVSTRMLGLLAAFSSWKCLDILLFLRVQDQRTKNTLSSHPNERALLAMLTARLHLADPDVIVGHNIRGFDMDVLTHRMESNKINMWSKVRPANMFGGAIHLATRACAAAVCAVNQMVG